ncbi:MAG TPA: hypothetical protein VF652_03720, partial [Allosphingosinicella sp.]
MKVAAFTKYGPMAASTRQRLIQYVPRLAAAGIEVRHQAFLPDAYVRGVAAGESFPRRQTLRAYLDRFRGLLGR